MQFLGGSVCNGTQLSLMKGNSLDVLVNLSWSLVPANRES